MTRTLLPLLLIILTCQPAKDATAQIDESWAFNQNFCQKLLDHISQPAKDFTSLSVFFDEWLNEKYDSEQAIEMASKYKEGQRENIDRMYKGSVIYQTFCK